MYAFRRPAVPAAVLAVIACALAPLPASAAVPAAAVTSAAASGAAAAVSAAPVAGSGAHAAAAASPAPHAAAFPDPHAAGPGRPAGRVESALASRARAPAATTRPRGVQASGAELMDVTTGRRLWSRGLDVRRPIASITKVMTALVVIRAGRLNRRIRISAAVVRYVLQHDGSSAGLRAGDVLTGRQLLEGMLVPSGCDAAFALAAAYGPGWRAFVRKMNATARRLGMTSTHFANFDGLPWPTERSTYSTPHDLVLLAEAAMKMRVFREIVRQRSHFIGATAQHGSYYWRTTNLLLGHYRGLAGIKTGQTAGAGYCLLFDAQRRGTDLTGVVLDSSETNPMARFTDAARLLNWGFRVVHW
jgi:serine-type D-Ala-D-Ala carboxypeptidase (penicillin-binding protein 5/6)